MLRCPRCVDSWGHLMRGRAPRLLQRARVRLCARPWLREDGARVGIRW